MAGGCVMGWGEGGLVGEMGWGWGWGAGHASGCCSGGWHAACAAQGGCSSVAHDTGSIALHSNPAGHAQHVQRLTATALPPRLHLQPITAVMGVAGSVVYVMLFRKYAQAMVKTTIAVSLLSGYVFAVLCLASGAVPFGIILLVVSVLITLFYWWIRDQLKMCGMLLAIAGESRGGWGGGEGGPARASAGGGQAVAGRKGPSAHVSSHETRTCAPCGIIGPAVVVQVAA